MGKGEERGEGKGDGGEKEESGKDAALGEGVEKVGEGLVKGLRGDSVDCGRLCLCEEVGEDSIGAGDKGTDVGGDDGKGGDVCVVLGED